MEKLRLCVCPVHRKCIDYEGEWDGTYDESFEYIIYDSEGIEVAGRGGYNSAEQAHEAGEKKLKEMEKRYGMDFS